MIDYQRVFDSSPGIILLLTPDFRIAGATRQRLEATMTRLEDILGRDLFEVFPDNPDDPEATGVANLRASLERVLRTKAADTMAVQRYDIQRPEEEGGGFEERYWSPVNAPVLDEGGSVELIIHRVEDVTPLVMAMREASIEREISGELRMQTMRMEGDIVQRSQELQKAKDALQAQAAELEHKTDLTKLIIERAHSAFVSMDANGLITEWNPSAERIFGWARRDALGRPVAEVVIPQRYRAAHERGLQRFLATGEGPVLNHTIDIEAVRRDGSEFPVALTISPIELDGVYTFHAFIQDISERKATELERERHRAELAHANERLAATDKLKDQFLAMASHEMRTPLTAISGFTATMQTMWAQLSEEQKQDFVSIIDTQAIRLQRLVDDLLTLARIESGAVQARCVDVTVALALKKTVREMGAEQVTVHCPEDLRALADPDQLQQILVNFVGNAIKYGHEPIELSARPVADAIEIRIVDHGDGVPSDFVPHLFQRFARASSTHSEIKGTGLGLSITRGLAQAQGGDAWYEPNQPQGSCFVLRLPASAGRGQHV